MKGFNNVRLLVQFYYQELSSVQSFDRLYRALLRLGAQPTGDVDLTDSRASLTKIVGGTDYVEETAKLPLDEIEQLLRAPTIRILELGITNAIGLTIEPDEYEDMSYQFISDEAAWVDHNPITITTKGSVFYDFLSGVDDRLRKLAAALGLKSYTRFVQLCRDTEPAYATMNVEYHWLTCEIVNKAK